MNMRIATIVGARPQFIKMAPLSREIRKHFEEIVVHTGQHYDYEMDRIFFEQLGIPAPDYNLGVGSGSHGYQTGEMLKRIEDVLVKEVPDLVIVYGDTNSTLAGALAASKLGIKIAHVEAGLRCYDKSVPEEVNRVLTDHISDYLFAPTENAVKCLQKEGITKEVYFTGDVMLDALLQNLPIAERSSKIMENLNLKPKDFILVTIHRPKNTEKDNLENIVDAIIENGNKVVFPVHPRTRIALERYGLMERLQRSSDVTLIKPVGYLDMLILEKNAKKILTDSGGIQKEAYFLGVPCIVLRDKTEWIELIDEGWLVLVGTNKKLILEQLREFSGNSMRKSYLFGNGEASSKITAIIRMVIKK